MNLDDFDPVEELPAPPRKDIPAADRELLELAARALGATFEEVDGEGYGNLHFADGSTVHAWNPLAFSGDTFDLAVSLGINIEFEHEQKLTLASWSDSKFAHEPHNDHPQAATRRAITRAAAEIGKQRS